jgi:hypothetical protein
MEQSEATRRGQERAAAAEAHPTAFNTAMVAERQRYRGTL